MASHSEAPGRSSFENLFELLQDFEDFNFSTFLDRLEQPKGEYIARVLGHAFESGDSGELDPSLIETLARSLMPSSCEAFFRKHSEFPFTHRDYYLSKVFQFNWVALIYGGFETCPELWNRLSVLVNEIPDAALTQLHVQFNIHKFFWWTRDYVSDTAALIDDLTLEAFMDGVRVEQNASSKPEQADSYPIDREQLYKDWKSRHPERGAQTKLLEKLHIDDADFRKWRSRKKFSDGSQVSERIVRGLNE